MSLLDRWVRRRKPAPEAPPALLPQLHDAGTDNWGIEAAVLSFLEERVTPEWTTVETGAGMSTVLFAEKGCTHVTVTTSDDEIARIRAHCRERQIDDGRVQFIVGSSVDVLPGLALPPLDLVMIDGGHGFPVPFVDWCYLAPRLKPGGLLIIDDVWLWTGAVLGDFLRAEWQWELVRTFGKAVAFRKLGDPVINDWGGQPYLMARSKLPPDWQWSCNTLHGHVVGLEATLDQLERQGALNQESIENLQWVEGELLDFVRRIEGVCARKAARS
jgi:hypothetical protein